MLVATPDALHHEIVMACATRRKHVFCEKPVGVNVRQAREMWTAYRDAGLAHYVPFWTWARPSSGMAIWYRVKRPVSVSK